MELALGHYNPVYSVSSGIYKKRQKFLWTLCIFRCGSARWVVSVFGFQQWIEYSANKYNEASLQYRSLVRNVVVLNNEFSYSTNGEP